MAADLFGRLVTTKPCEQMVKGIQIASHDDGCDLVMIHFRLEQQLVEFAPERPGRRGISVFDLACSAVSRAMMSAGATSSVW